MAAQLTAIRIFENGEHLNTMTWQKHKMLSRDLVTLERAKAQGNLLRSITFKPVYRVQMRRRELSPRVPASAQPGDKVLTDDGGYRNVYESHGCLFLSPRWAL